MAVFLRARLSLSIGQLAWSLASYSPRGAASLGRTCKSMQASPLTARTSPPAAREMHAVVGERRASEAEQTGSELHEELFRVLCQPRASNPAMLALVRGIVAAGETPSLAAVQALTDRLASAKDAMSLKAVLSLLKGAKSGPAAGAHVSQEIENAVGLVFHGVVRAFCQRQDVASALAEVEAMEAAGRQTGAEIFSCLLDACAIGRPPLLREAETVWAQIEERGLTTSSGVRQQLFCGRIAAHASGAGYAPPGQSQEDWQKALLDKVDETWDGMLKALAAEAAAAAGGCLTHAEVSASQEGEELVARDSWIALASALALCVRDAGPISDEAMSRSLKALRWYQKCGGKFSGNRDTFALAEVVRGMARCGRQDEVAALLADVRRMVVDPAEESAAEAVADNKNTAVEMANARTAATRAARIPGELLRALGARGLGLDFGGGGGGRSYGLSLLKVVEDVAVEASAFGECSRDGVDSRLTATLQATLAAVRFLDRGDAAVIDGVARSALDRAAADAAVTEDSLNGAVAGSTWPGPNLAALSLLALLHVSQNRWEGIPAALDVLQQMHDRGFTPPASLAAQLEVVFKRHGTMRQKRRASFLLARALEGFRPPPDEIADGGDGKGDQEVLGGEIAAPGGGGGGARGAARLGDAIREMVKASTTRQVGEWDPSVEAGAGDSGSAHDGGADADSVSGDPTPLSAEAIYRQRQKLRANSLGGSTSAGVRSIEKACAAATAAAAAGGESRRQDDGKIGERHLPAAAAAAAAAVSAESGAADSHHDILWRVTVLAEKGRAHPALAALQAVDGRKRGTRLPVPYKVYALLFRALSNAYSARGVRELELAAAPTEALEWLLRGMARQGYRPNTTILNFGLEAFAVAAQTRKVRAGEEEARAQVGAAAMDFMEGMRDGWNGLFPPVAPNLVSFNIIIKVMCRLRLFDQAFEALDVMERGVFKPDRYTYGTLIHGLAKAGDNDGAWEVMVEMTNNGILPDSIVIDGIVDGFVRSGEVGEAISFAQHAFNQYGCPPTAKKYCMVMHAAAALDDGQHEARRGIVVAEQMWAGEWKGEGKTDHPVLGHASLRRILEDRGALDKVNRL